MKRVSRRLHAMTLPVLLLAGVPGCVHWLADLPPRLPPCTGPIPSTRSLPPGDWLVRQRLRVVGRTEGSQGEAVDVGFEVVAEKIGQRLAVVGFHSVGAKGFSIVQEGDEVEVESHLGRALAVPPINVLRDLHAAGLGDPAGPRTVRVARPECGYTATFVRVERRTMAPSSVSGGSFP